MNNKPAILFYDIGNYGMFIQIDGSISIISKRAKNDEIRTILGVIFN